MSLSSTKCCVPGCMDSERMQLPLHVFPNPARERQRFNSWVHSIRGDIIGMDSNDIYKYRRVCHAHFEEKFYCRNSRLSKIAMPTLNLPGPLSLLKPTIIERRPMRTQSSPNIVSSSSNAEELGYNLYSMPSTSKGSQTISQVNPTFSESGICIKENMDPAPNIPSVNQEIISNPSAKLDLSIHSKSDYDRIDQETVNVAEKGNGSFKRGFVTRRLRKIATTPSEKILYRKLVQVSNKLSKCRTKIKKQTLSLKAAKNFVSNPQFMKTMDNLSSSAKILTMMQFRECKKKEKGRRFSLEEKVLALSIMKQSPKAYRFLRKIYVLPAPQTLVKVINMANIKPGINKNIFAQLKKVTEKMTTEERLCILIFDEMSLKANLTYNERKDNIIGFVTDGITTRGEFADHSQVFMIRGLIKNYKQPVSYTFSASATKGPELAKQIKEIIKELLSAGLIVVATICDQGTNNRQAVKLLIQETRGNFLRNEKEPKDNIFMVDDYEIFPLYDPPHLLKCIRNNLMVKHLKYEETKVAKWHHLEMLHKENPGYKGIRLLPKLTDHHVVPAKIAKMKVKYASQVFSQTVASTMGYLADRNILPMEAKETADILLFFDKLFDSMNGSYSKIKKFGKPLLGPVKPKSVHYKQWGDAKRRLKTMKFVNAANSREENVPTINNWIWTLEGIQSLLKYLENKYKCKSIWMRHLNQDPIENFFGAIRSQGCRNVNPTAEQFQGAYTTLLINSLSSVHATGANCETDNCLALHALIITDNRSDCRATPCELENIPDINVTSIEEKRKNPRIIGPLQYVSGYFVRITKKKIFRSCNICIKNLTTDVEPEFLKSREYEGRMWLCSPSESLLMCISNLQDINYCIIKENLEKQNLKEMITTAAHTQLNFDFIKCKKHKESIINLLITVSCRFFIYNYCKEINRILAGKRDNDDDEDLMKCKAKKYHCKCFKRKHK